jgi:hypothetical protein
MGVVYRATKNRLANQPRSCECVTAFYSIPRDGLAEANPGGSSQASRAIRTAALEGDCSLSTCGLSTWWSPTAL